MATVEDKSTGNDYQDKLVCVNRTSKVVKGGRVFGFSALVVIGDGNGRVGSGFGKAKEVPAAIKKAMESARRNMITVPLHQDTIQHAIGFKNGATRIMLRPAPQGTGIIAGNAMRAVFEMVGIHNIVAKSLGSNNPINMVRTTIMALQRIVSPDHVAMKRGKTVKEVLHHDGE